ncbi:MAG: phosphoribosyltransferase [Trueperaceae bacterium]|nr:phosphoribosyltransferase [Trueperaceae bacterium]
MDRFSQQNQPFDDRQDAGRQLGELLRERLDDDARADAVVLGLARGGIPVAYEVAKLLERPLDVFVVRKLGAPGHEELAIGAIASGDVRVMNDDVVRQMRVGDDAIEEIAAQEREELQRREQRYRGAREAVPLEGRPVIIVDDGLATGASMRAAVSALEQRNPSTIVVAVPTGAPDTCAMFEDMVDEVVCLQTPQPFGGVGRWYKSFPQTKDDEVTDLLEKSVSSA